MYAQLVDTLSMEEEFQGLMNAIDLAAVSFQMKQLL
jgi:hypothetical protein